MELLHLDPSTPISPQVSLIEALARKQGAVLLLMPGNPPERIVNLLDVISAGIKIIITPPPPPTPQPPPPLFVPSQGSRIIKVSSSEGSDTEGRVEGRPYKTIAMAKAMLRNGYPDWLLLKRGDTFNEPIGRWKTSGHSPVDPQVVWTYGEGSRPVLLCGPQTGLEIAPGGGSPPSISFLSISGLRFYAHTRDPRNSNHQGPAGGNGVRIAHNGTDLLFDDCRFDFFVNGLTLEGWQSVNPDAAKLERVTVRHCGVFDSYNESGHSQGIFASQVKSGLVIEDSFFDHNGWGEKAGAADDPTIYNHNLYIQSDCGEDVIVQRNILSRAASHGLQLRSGGIIRDNFVYRCPIGLQTGYGPAPNPASKYLVQGNVVVEGTDITPEPNKAGGWGIVFASPAVVRVVGNIVAHCKSTKSNRRSIVVEPFATYEDNIVHDWTSGTSYRVLPPTPGPFVDPTRKVEDLYGTAGNFYDAMRASSRDVELDYDVFDLLRHYQAGFARSNA